MEKAYDLKVLGERLKEQGLPIAKEALEDTAKKVYVVVKDWAKESAPISKTPVDDFVAPFYDQLDPLILGAIDKIDGEEG